MSNKENNKGEHKCEGSGACGRCLPYIPGTPGESGLLGENSISSFNKEEKKCCEKCKVLEVMNFSNRTCYNANCPCHSSPEVPSWEEEFDKIGVKIAHLADKGNGTEVGNKLIELRNICKSLLSTEQRGYERGLNQSEWEYTKKRDNAIRAETLQSLKEKVGKMKKEKIYPVTKKLSRKSAKEMQAISYNQALQDFLTLLENEI